MIKTITTIPQLTSAILNGDLDANLDALSRSIKYRRETLSNQKRDSLNVGDTVYFVKTVKPSYLAGVAATVKKFNTNRIVVDLARPIGRFSSGIRTPLSLITTEKPV